MLTTTLKAIRENRPCAPGWEKLLAHLGKTKADEQPLSFETILESNGLGDAIWCLRALPKSYDPACRLLACDFAESALNYVPEGEDRPRHAIEVARRYARGEATDSELADARCAVFAAASASAWPAVLASAWVSARSAARSAV